MEGEKDLNYEHYLQPPRQQLFYQKLAFVMTLFGIGQNSWWGLPPLHNILIWHSHSVLIVAPTCLLLQLIYMYINFDDLSFRTLGTMFSIIPATSVVVMKLFICLISSYQDIMRDLMDKIHIYNFWQDGDDFIKLVKNFLETCFHHHWVIEKCIFKRRIRACEEGKNGSVSHKLIQVERYTRWVTSCLVIFILFDWLLWIFVPVINNMKNKEFIENRTIRMETCLYMWMPFDYGYDYQKWIITHALNVYLIGIGAFVLAIYDSINFIFIFHFLSHIDILKHKIKTFFADELNDVEAKERIVSVIKYHSFILNTFKDMQAAFGINVGVNYAHNLIVDSLLLYQIMVGDKANRLTYVIMMQFHMGGLILLSLALEKIRMETDDLALDLYKIPWEKMSAANQKLLIPVLSRMQTALVFKASGGLRAGVRPLASILKSTFSYYVMLESSIK